MQLFTRQLLSCYSSVQQRGELRLGSSCLPLKLLQKHKFVHWRRYTLKREMPLHAHLIGKMSDKTKCQQGCGDTGNTSRSLPPCRKESCERIFSNRNSCGVSQLKKWICKLWLINMIEYYSTFKMNELDPHVSTQISQCSIE